MSGDSVETQIKKLDALIEIDEKSIESIDITVHVLDKGKVYKENKMKVIKNLKKKGRSNERI